MLKVVFICTGNICRSPMAEGILKHRWGHSGKADLGVTSMGIGGMENEPASNPARQICLQNGIDISHHRSRSLKAAELAAADIILTMERFQKKHIQLFFPLCLEKMGLLGAWPGEDTRKSDIGDPIGCPIKVYARVFAKIEHHIDRIMPTLQLMAAGRP